MSDIFISHIKGDSATALEIAAGLEAAGYATWYYERDIRPGRSHLEQTSQAIEAARVILLLLSQAALTSHEVDSEVDWAYLSRKPFVPVLAGLNWEDFEQHQRKWRRILGSAVGISIPTEGVPALIPGVIEGLKALGIQPKTAEEREVEAQARQRNEQLDLLRNTAMQFTRNRNWSEATATWQQYLALEPEDREAAQAQLQRAEKQGELAVAYEHAQAALSRKDYDTAIKLLKGIVAQDESYQHAARLLADTIEHKTAPRQIRLPIWQVAVGLGAIAAIVILAVVLPRLRATSSPTEGATPSLTAASATDKSTRARDAIAGTATSASPASAPATQTQSGGATPTPTLKPTQKPPAATQVQMPTANIQSTATTQASVADTEGTVLVPDKLVGEFFAPSRYPAALAVVSNTLWLVDSPRLYHLDRSGALLGSFPITVSGYLRELSWDGQTLQLRLEDNVPPKIQQTVRLDLTGRILGIHEQPTKWGVYRVYNPIDGTTWELRESEDYLIQFDATGDLLQTQPWSCVNGNISRFTWARDGFWLLSNVGEWCRIGFDGRQLIKGEWAKSITSPRDVALDEDGFLWLIDSDQDRKVYQFSTRREAIPPIPPPAPAPTVGPGQVLPRPQFKRGAMADQAMMHITNDLQGAMILELNIRSIGDTQSMVIEPGQTWSADVPESVFEIFVSANLPKPIAFSGRELLLSGYEYTWVLSRPE